MVRNKRFREDLLHRLNTFTITIPPLRESREDIFELAHNYLANFNREYDKKNVIRVEGMTALQNYSFPGNVRELVNIMREAVVMCDNQAIDRFIIKKLNKAPTMEPDFAQGFSVDVPFSLEHELDCLAKIFGAGGKKMQVDS